MKTGSVSFYFSFIKLLVLLIRWFLPFVFLLFRTKYIHEHIHTCMHTHIHTYTLFDVQISILPSSKNLVKQFFRSSPFSDTSSLETLGFSSICCGRGLKVLGKKRSGVHTRMKEMPCTNKPSHHAPSHCGSPGL